MKDELLLDTILTEHESVFALVVSVVEKFAVFELVFL